MLQTQPAAHNQFLYLLTPGPPLLPWTSLTATSDSPRSMENHTTPPRHGRVRVSGAALALECPREGYSVRTTSVGKSTKGCTSGHGGVPITTGMEPMSVFRPLNNWTSTLVRSRAVYR